MEQNKLLNYMFFTFSDSLKHLNSQTKLLQNYEKQLNSYSRLFSFIKEENDEQKRLLICARCLISATRSLVSKGYKNENIAKVLNELNYLGPIFNGKRMSSVDLNKLIDRRISKLMPSKSDEMIDSVLFMYFSLSENQKNLENEQNEPAVL